jgi:tetratricopeptide (TPR) repeat protein
VLRFPTLLRIFFSLLFVLNLCIGISYANSSTKLDEIFSKNYPLETADLEHLYQYKLDRGVRNLSLASYFLMRGSNRLLTDKKFGKAVEYAEYALLLSPGYPPAYFHLGKVYFIINKLRFHSVFVGWFNSLKAGFRNYPYAAYLLSNHLWLLFLSFLLLIGVFSFISLCKYLKLFIHDLSHFFPFDLPLHLYFLWGIFIVILPFFFQWSIFLILFYWLILLFVYHTKKEQILIIIFAFFFLSSPYLIQLVSKIIATSSSDVFYSLYQVNDDTWDDGTERQLREWLDDNPKDIDALFALGLLKKREGSYRAAQDYYERVLSEDPNNYRALCNLGNVMLARNKAESAIENYNRCISAFPGSVTGYYNLSRVQLLEYKFKESDKNFKKAAALNPEQVDAFVEIYSENSNRRVIDEFFPLQNFWEKTFQPSPEKMLLSNHFWNKFFRGLPYKFWYAVFFVFFIFVCLIYVDRYRKGLSLSCDYCGRAVCKKCKTFVSEYNLCKQCAGIFKGSRNISISVKNKEGQVISIERFHKRHIIIAKLLSFLLPGGGHLLFDKPVKGALMLFVFFFLALKLLFYEGFINNPWLIVNAPAFGTLFILSALLLFLYLYAIIDFSKVSVKLTQFLSLIRATRKELQIQRSA